jgi:glycine/D-amino acid oxidase-like deaminating enzyme
MFSKALASGNMNLQTTTPATGIYQDTTANDSWVIETPRGKVRARQVIVAANAYTASLLPEYKEKIIPYRTVCSRIVTPGPERPPLLPSSYALRFNPWDFDYLIPRPDGSIIVGGARRTYLRDLDEWYSNVDDSKVIEKAKGYFDGYMQRHFRGWENTGAYTDQVWSGSKSFSAPMAKR